jgi:hypothetical protein
VQLERQNRVALTGVLQPLVDGAGPLQQVREKLPTDILRHSGFLGECRDDVADALGRATHEVLIALFQSYAVFQPYSNRVRFQGRVELQEWFRPQLAFVQLLLNDLENRGIGNVEETADVGRVVCNDAGMGLKNIHSR